MSLGEEDIAVQNGLPKSEYLRRAATTFTKLGLLIGVMYYVALTLYRTWLGIDWSALTFRPEWIWCGVGLLAGSHVVGSWAYQILYHSLGSNLSWIHAFILLTVPSLGKYLPGKVLALAGHATIARSFGAPLMISGTAILYLTGLSLITTCLLGSVLLWTSSPLHFMEHTSRLALASVALGGMFFMLHPAIYSRLMNTVLRLLKRSPLQITLSTETMVLLAAVLLIQNALYISGVSVVVLGFVTLPSSILPSLIGASCLANVAGFVALFAPAGIGVREAFLLLILTPTAGAGGAGLITVLTRLIHTLVDASFAAPGFMTLAVLRHRRLKM